MDAKEINVIEVTRGVAYCDKPDICFQAKGPQDNLLVTSNRWVRPRCLVDESGTPLDRNSAEILDSALPECGMAD